MKPFLKVPVFIFSLALLCIQCEKEHDPNDPIDIPDQHFFNALIEDGVDINGDGRISYGEAEMVTTIYLDPDSASKSKGKILSLEGIEAFINLDTLHFCSNQIKELDVSANTELRVLVCWNDDDNDQLERLNVSKNNKLEQLSIPGNKLTELDVSNNPSLHKLSCGYNQIMNLVVSNCINLAVLECSNNQLSSLDISDNKDLGTSYNPALILRDMPSLTEVCVWTLPFPPTGFYGFEIDTTGSPNVYFTTDCSN